MSQPQVHLKEVGDDDLDVFFANEQDPAANRMAAFPARDRDAFLAHWAKVRADPTTVTRAIVADGEVAGNIGSWEQDGEREVSYWIARRHWGRGVATRALTLLLGEVATRPLYAHVAAHNAGSIRVLEKCGFRRTTGPDGSDVTVASDGIAELTFVLAE